jgi:hypothetical protein
VAEASAASRGNGGHPASTTPATTCEPPGAFAIRWRPCPFPPLVFGGGTGGGALHPHHAIPLPMVVNGWSIKSTPTRRHHGGHVLSGERLRGLRHGFNTGNAWNSFHGKCVRYLLLPSPYNRRFWSMILY